MMSDGVRDGRIITTPPRYWSVSASGTRRRVAHPAVLPAPDEAHFVYRRQGLDCRELRNAGGADGALAARKLYWCPPCQAA